MNGNATVLSSRVRLARNYEDLPFDTAERPEDAETCLNRTVNAMKLSGADDGFLLYRLSSMREAERGALAESHLISRDLLQHPDTAAVLLNAEEALSVMINEEDHLRIQAIVPGQDIQTAANRCFRIEDALSGQARFAFDSQLGYLTAYPTNTGTGMRASLLMHLPMLTQGKQMGNVGQIAAKVGLTIRGVYGEGSEALGNLYLVTNQVTLGRTEQEIGSTVNAVGMQLSGMEMSLREKSLQEKRIQTEDEIFRAWGLMRNARLMNRNEFFRIWSAVRLGASLGMLPVTLSVMDAMLDQAQDAHLRAYAEADLQSADLQEARASCVRRMLDA